jgi:hypothetical protein
MPAAIGALAIDNGTVLVLITLLVAPIAAIAFARSAGAWEAIGKGPLAIEPAPPATDDGATPSADDAELRIEVRQLVVSGNERRRRQGLEPLDVEAETERQIADLVGSP